MYRWLALLILPSLVGCHASSQPPTTSIDSYRNAYLNGRTPPAPPAQVAAMPRPPALPDAEPSAPAAEPTSGASAGADREAAPSPPAATAAGSAEHARPPRYKASVAAYIKRYAVDANSLKQAKIGTPFPGSVHGQKGSVVCVELDGIKADRTAYLLQDDAVIDSEYGADICESQHLASWNDHGT